MGHEFFKFAYNHYFQIVSVSTLFYRGNFAVKSNPIKIPMQNIPIKNLLKIVFWSIVYNRAIHHEHTPI